MSYEDQLIRESTERATDEPWCSVCERNSNDCICLEEATPKATGEGIEMEQLSRQSEAMRIVTIKAMANGTPLDQSELRAQANELLYGGLT